MSLWQRCPNCGEPHDVSVHVSGHRLACRRCALPFEVFRRDVGGSVAALSLTSPPAELLAAAGPALASLAPAALRSREVSLEPTLAAGVRPPPLKPIAPPRQLPGFELTDLLGRGGMGEVWRARQLSLGRDVAVKILSRDLASDPDFVKRFELEAAALTSLSHPHVVAIIDRGRHEDLLFFAMEFVDGKSLRERLAPGPLTVTDAAALLAQVLSALHHAHHRGIVHRDLKPENVLLSAHGAVKVADFGLAAMLDRRSQDRITRSSVAMGTMSYMAPEQRRDAHAVDQRADLYSAGVVLYELLTGEVPAGRFELPSRLRAGVPKAIDQVLERALAAEPRDRFQSAEEMAQALALGVTPGGLKGAFARLFGRR